jgi:lipopolysaccharide export system protein LptC
MSPKRIARALAAVGAVALCVIAIVTVRVVRGRSVRQAFENAAGLMPDSLLHAHNFHWTQMKGSQNQWVLKAKDASYASDKTTLVLSGVDLLMTAPDGKRLELIASRARLKLNGNHINTANLGDGIIVHYGDYVISTEQAVFTPDTDLLVAPGAVKIEGNGLTITGVGLNGHPKEEIFQVLDQVITQVSPRHQGASSKLS